MLNVSQPTIIYLSQNENQNQSREFLPLKVEIYIMIKQYPWNVQTGFSFYHSDEQKPDSSKELDNEPEEKTETPVTGKKRGRPRKYPITGKNTKWYCWVISGMLQQISARVYEDYELQLTGNQEDSELLISNDV